jgi:hypothetical protein
VLKFLLAAHLVFAVFAIGPLVHAATTASRGVRRGDGAATASAARTLRIYGYASVLVIIAGFGLMSQKRETEAFGWYASDQLAAETSRAYNGTLTIKTDEHIAEFGDTFIWLSLVLWLAAMAIVLGVLVPTLNKVTKEIEAENSVVTLTARVAAAGGVVALIFLAIVVIMVYKPGS